MLILDLQLSRIRLPSRQLCLPAYSHAVGTSFGRHTYQVSTVQL